MPKTPRGAILPLKSSGIEGNVGLVFKAVGMVVIVFARAVAATVLALGVLACSAQAQREMGVTPDHLSAQEPSTIGQKPEPSNSPLPKYPGAAATRAEYLAYVHSLIRQHYNLLPLAMIGDRQGEAQIEFVVLHDGTIATVRVRHSSGWPDIDERVEQIILTVHHVPPLPQWFQGPSMALILNVPFPGALHE